VDSGKNINVMVFFILCYAVLKIGAILSENILFPSSVYKRSFFILSSSSGLRLLFHHEDWDSKSFQNVSTYLSIYIVSYPRKLSFKLYSPCVPKILCKRILPFDRPN
jgi:hypothetical protein